MKKLAGLWISIFVFFGAYTKPGVFADSVSVGDTAILPGNYALVAGGSILQKENHEKNSGSFFAKYVLSNKLFFCLLF